jgi:hypothetical protein
VGKWWETGGRGWKVLMEELLIKKSIEPLKDYLIFLLQKDRLDDAAAIFEMIEELRKIKIPEL